MGRHYPTLSEAWIFQMLIVGIWVCDVSSSPDNANPYAYYSLSSFDPYYIVGSLSGSDVKLNDSMPWFKEPLWGLTYVPYRRSTNCSKISERDVIDDLRNISRLAHLIYMPEMYCHFGSVIVNATFGSNKLILGLSLRTKTEFERQYLELKRAMKSNSNISHISCISVGYNDLQRYLVSRDTDFVVSALKRVKNLVLNSTNPLINVTTNDAYSLLFDQPWTSYLDAYMALISVDSDRSPLFAFTRVVDTFNNVKHLSGQIDGIRKRIYTTGAGWPSAGGGFPPKFDRDSMRSNKRGGVNASEPVLGNPDDQAEFIARLVCGAHRKDGIRYFYHYAFDPLWLYSNESDQKAHWGLIDADRVALKPAAAQALSPNCGPVEPELNEFEAEEPTRRQRQAEYRIRAIGSGVGLLLLFALMLSLILVFWRRKRDADKQRLELSTRHPSTGSSNDTNSTSPIYRCRAHEEYIGMADAALYADLKAMVDPKSIVNVGDLDFKEMIGEGHFGIVQKAIMTKDGEQATVAVKRLHDCATNVRQFILEGLRMEKLHHSNVLHLTGICFVNQSPMIILPFMENDNLLAFVSNPKTELTVRRILDFCIQISDGMQYLHSMKLVHRDLAARNCMLDASFAVKISDFGLCRDISETDSYQATRTFELPIRWMAPETILKLMWTNKSDVWSYGVVVWELLTRGKQPYKNILLIELRLHLENGGRLPKPKYCPDIVYDFMKTCWHQNPEERPEFSALRHTLSHLIQAVDDGRVGDVTAYYNVISIIENDSTEHTSGS